MRKDKIIYNIAMAAFIILTVGIIFSGFYIMSKIHNKTNEVISELGDISTNIRNKFKNSPGYWGLDTDFVMENHLAKIDEGILKNILGKKVLVGSGFQASKLMPGSKTFDVVYRNLDKKECIAIAGYSFTEEQKASLIAIIIRENGEETEFTWGGENRLPISNHTAKRFCKENNDILWRFE